MVERPGVKQDHVVLSTGPYQCFHVYPIMCRVVSLTCPLVSVIIMITVRMVTGTIIYAFNVPTLSFYNTVFSYETFFLPLLFSAHGYEEPDRPSFGCKRREVSTGTHRYLPDLESVGNPWSYPVPVICHSESSRVDSCRGFPSIDGGSSVRVGCPKEK